MGGVGEIRFRERAPQPTTARRTHPYEVTFQDGQKRTKLLDEEDAKRFEEAGCKLKKLPR